MTMSCIWIVTQMSVGTEEISHLLLWPRRSELMIQSVSLLRFCARVNMWLRTQMCLQVYLPSFKIVGYLIKVCSSVTWCEHNSHVELDLFPPSHDIIIKPPEWAVWGDHWVCGGGRSPEPVGRRWSVPTTNKMISTYNTSDEDSFIFISYKREAYGRPDPRNAHLFVCDRI